MTSSHTSTPFCQWFCRLASTLDPRSAPRLARLFFGALLAIGRRTVTDWIRTCGLSAEFRNAYTAVAAAGKRTEIIASRLLSGPLAPIVDAQDRVLLAIDDTPTPRYGSQVQGAGLHHNPTPGPSRSAWVYGHVWVVLALVASHPCWGTIALPFLASRYIREKDLARTSALSLLYMYANSVRSQQGLGNIRQPPLPAGVQQWIDRQITAADAAFHNPGAQAFQSIANDLLSQLRAVEHLFINHPEED